MFGRPFALAALAALLAAAPTPALADPDAASTEADTDRAAIVELEVSGDAAPELRRSIGRSVAEGLAAAGLRTLGFDETSAKLAARSDLVGCGSAACVRDIGELLAVGQLVRARVESRGADYAIELELVDVDDASVARQVTETCTVCTVGDLARRIDEAARRLVAAPPAPAAVQPTTVDLAPRPTPAPTDHHRVLGWSLAAGGAVALIAGVALVVADGGGTCNGPGECERIYDTSTAGWATVALGVGLAAGAGWVFYRDRERAASLAITPRGATFGLAF